MNLIDDEVFDDTTTTSSEVEVELISKPKLTHNSSIDENILEL
jgi:hypothetical protein